MIKTISSAQQTANLRNLILRQKEDLNKASIELATGLKYDVYSLRGAAPSQSLEFRSRFSTNEAYLVSNQRLALKLETQYTALSQFQSDAQDYMETIVSGDLAGADRDMLKDIASTKMQELANALNASYDGQFLFSGDAVNQSPIQINADNTVTYLGSADALTAQTGDASKLTIETMANDPDIANIFAQLTLVMNTDLNAMSKADFQDFQRSVAESLGSSLQGVVALQARLGNQQGMLNKTIESQESLSNILNADILNIEAVDAEEAAVKVESISYMLQGSFEVTNRLSEMSFLNFMR